MATAMPMYPLLAQATNPFAGMEQSIVSAIRAAVGFLFNNSWYAFWVYLSVLLVVVLLIVRILFRTATVFMSGKEGVIGLILRDTTIAWCIVFAATYPQLFGEFVFSTFELVSALADTLLFDGFSGTVTLVDLITAGANAVQASTLFDPLGLIWAASWFMIFLAVMVITAAYYIHWIDALGYLYVVFPFLLRPAVVGLMVKPTSGWFWSVANLGLEQLLKPLFGKVFLWFTFSVLVQGLEQIAAAPTTIEKGISIVAWYIVVALIGVFLQLKVPQIAKVAAVGAGGATRDLFGSGTGGVVAGVVGGLAAKGLQGGLGRLPSFPRFGGGANGQPGKNGASAPRGGFYPKGGAGGSGGSGGRGGGGGSKPPFGPKGKPPSGGPGVTQTINVKSRRVAGP